jgi:ribonuclease H2 subunit A
MIFLIRGKMHGLDIRVKAPKGVCGKVCVGIDEAGRGPVLGPMVYACCFWPVGHDVPQGFDDSKKLTEAQREFLFDSIKRDDKIGFVTGAISAKHLSEQMLRLPEPVSLNKIAQDATFRLLDELLQLGLKLDEIFVDALGNCDFYEKLLSSRYPGAQVCVKPKADSLFKVVSAASICAKVSRDQALANWEFRETGINFSPEWGCGYPGDELTKQWLRAHIDEVFGFPDFVRFSWQTTKNLLEHDDTQKVVKIRLHDMGQTRGSQTLQGMFKRARTSRGHWLAQRGIAQADFCTLGTDLHKS